MWESELIKSEVSKQEIDFYTTTTVEQNDSLPLENVGKIIRRQY